MDPTHIDIITGATRGLRRDAAVASGVLASRWRTATRTSRQRNLHLPHRRLLRRLDRLLNGPSALSIFFEVLPTAWMDVSPVAVFVPNQEWIRDEVERNLRRCSEMWCKTRYAEGLFRDKGYKARYVGFSAADIYRSDVTKDYGQAIHVAGRSHLKGTRPLLEVWSLHPEWPKLTVVTLNPNFRRFSRTNIEILVGDMDEERLTRLMNRCGIHLCPSETEGFGHYISEAMSTKALVVTVDAPPMNELVSEAYGILVKIERTEDLNFGKRFFVDRADLEARIAAAVSMPVEAMIERGHLARAAFLRNRAVFEDSLVSAVEELTPAE